MIVITHEYEGYSGVRYLGEKGLKAYYLPIPSPIANVSFPTAVVSLPFIRHVLIKS